MSDPSDLAHPFPEPPSPGEVVEVASGILWARLPLPFRLNHVNVYILADEDGWTVIDAGIGDDATRAAWDQMLAGPLAGRPLRRLVVTHCHPDHVGAAGWLAAAHGLALEMSETEYLTSLVLHLDPAALEAGPYRDFYTENGLDRATTDVVVTRGHEYLKMLTGLPSRFRRVVAGERLRIGGRDFEVFTGGGHSPEQIMLYARADGIFLSADQVLPRISPNVSVMPRDPEGDPLGIFLRSLREVRAAVAADVLVLPGHDGPFVGLHRRVDDMAAHHAERCDVIREACRAAPRSAAELVPVVFRRELDPHQTGFAFTEIMAHINYMRRRERLGSETGADGVSRFAAL